MTPFWLAAADNTHTHTDMLADVLKLCQIQEEEEEGAVALILQRDWSAEEENKPQSAGLLTRRARDWLERLRRLRDVYYFRRPPADK